MTSDTPADRLREWMSLDPRADWEAEPDAFGRAVADLDSLVAEIADLRKYNERVKQQRETFFGEMRRLDADVGRLRAEVQRLTAEAQDHEWRGAMPRTSSSAAVNSVIHTKDTHTERVAECVTLRQALAEIVGHAYNLMTQGESPTQLRQPSAQRIYDTALAALAEVRSLTKGDTA